jgi:Rrf2 family protein
MLSQKAKYALRALLMLARHNRQQPLQIADISEQQHIPRKFLESILLELKHHGLVESRRGKKGGYSLLKSPSDIYFGQLIRLIDGPLGPLPCVSKAAFRPCPDCQDIETCEIRRVMQRVRDATAAVLDTATLAEAIDDSGKMVQAVEKGICLF